MNCQACDGTGFWGFVDENNPKTDAQVTVDDLQFALCLCAAGMALRNTDNNGHKVPALWQVWCHRHQIAPSRVFRIEDVLTPERLASKGLTTQPVMDREAALLAKSRARR
jgi:hypothetical protein